MKFLAHSKNSDGQGVIETLEDHLRLVATRTATFSSHFGVKDQGFAIGLLHDLGKYSEQFIRRLTDPREKGRDHWSIGALCAAKI